MSIKETEAIVSGVVAALAAARKQGHAYQMGFDAAVNGANTTNCHFGIFSTRENTDEWERGNRDGLRALATRTAAHPKAQ